MPFPLRSAFRPTIVLALAASLSCQSHGRPVPDGERSLELLSLSFPRVALEANERIVGLEIVVTHGSVKALDNIPVDWSVDLKVDPPWQSKVVGSTHHGVGALVDASQLDSFLVIRPWYDADSSFDVEATLYTTSDFERTKTRSLKKNDLIWRPSKRMNAGSPAPR